jgi:hypothetical protein
LLAAEPEKYSELIAKVTGIDAEVNYLFHGPLGLQTRDLSWKPEYRQAVGTSIDTLKLLKKADRGLDPNTFIDDQYIRAPSKAGEPGLRPHCQLRANPAQSRRCRDRQSHHRLQPPGRDLGARRTRCASTPRPKPRSPRWPAGAGRQEHPRGVRPGQRQRHQVAGRPGVVCQ